MRILCVDYDNPYAAAPGGQFQETKRTIFPLAAKHSVTILTGDKVPTNQTYPVRYIGLPVGIGRQFDFIRGVRNYIAQHRDFDLVLEKFTSPIGPIGLPNLTDKPVIGIANFLFWSQMSHKYHLPFSLVAHRLLKQYRSVICHDEQQSRQLKAANSELHIALLPPALQALPKQPTQTGNTLLFIGRPDVDQKGLDLLGSILSLVTEKDMPVVIAGGATSLPNYTGQLPIAFVGYLDDDQKAAAYQAARFLLMPSRYESFGLVQLEAASYGRPTVAFDLPVFQPRKRAMLLVPPFDCAAFARGIESLWSDSKQYRSLSQDSRSLAASYVSNNQKNGLAAEIERVMRVTRPT